MSHVVILPVGPPLTAVLILSARPAVAERAGSRFIARCGIGTRTSCEWRRPHGAFRDIDGANGLNYGAAGMQLDVKAGRMQPLKTARNSESFRGCNDLHIATNGDIYFTDQVSWSPTSED
jgi:hypothetical protein